MKLSKLIQHLPDKQKINIYSDIDLVFQGLSIFKAQVKFFDNESFLSDREVLAFFTLSKSDYIYIKIKEDDYENC